MKNAFTHSIYPLLIVITFVAVACSPTSTVTKIYLQDIEVFGPISQLPVHIADSTESGITISPRFSFNTKKLSGEKLIIIH